VVEFVLVTVLLALLLFGVIQVAAVFYVRSVIAAAASDGARYEANAGVESGAGGERATQLIARGLSTGAARAFQCVEQPQVDAATGAAVAVVRCQGRMRSVFLPVAALFEIGATGKSLREVQ
jgi:Flp pilus assembly protein TadG